eukprot:1949764-Heterocapsa_arctica.AAC.1
MGAKWGNLPLVPETGHALPRLARNVDGEKVLEHGATHQKRQRRKALLHGQILAKYAKRVDQGGDQNQHGEREGAPKDGEGRKPRRTGWCQPAGGPMEDAKKEGLGSTCLREPPGRGLGQRRRK